MLSRSGPGNRLSQGKRWSGTVDGDRGNKVLDNDTVRLLKTQDMAYVRTVRNAATKEATALEQRILSLGGSIDENDWADEEDDEEEENDFDFGDDEEMTGTGGLRRLKPRKIVFAEDEEERDVRMQISLRGEDDDDSGDGKVDDEKAKSEAKRARDKQALLGKLQRRLENSRKKIKTLNRAEHEMEVQRAKMAKTATSGGYTKSGQKIKVRERKR
jgi:U3 small nucleolar RNA-associated protein 11